MRKKRFSVKQMMGILKQAEVGYQPHLAAERAGAAHAGERVRRRRIFRRGQLRRAERAAQRSPPWSSWTATARSGCCASTPSRCRPFPCRSLGCERLLRRLPRAVRARQCRQRPGFLPVGGRADSAGRRAPGAARSSRRVSCRLRKCSPATSRAVPPSRCRSRRRAGGRRPRRGTPYVFSGEWLRKYEALTRSSLGLRSPPLYLPWLSSVIGNDILDMGATLRKPTPILRIFSLSNQLVATHFRFRPPLMGALRTRRLVFSKQSERSDATQEVSLTP